MAKGPKGFSDDEKMELRTKLCAECERSWALHGYKKTSIGELTAKIGISTGAFYLLYTAKEDLFCDTLERVQKKLKDKIQAILNEQKGRSGFISAMLWHFEEFDKSPFLYHVNAPDFLAFINKLPKDRIERLHFDSETFFYDTINLAGLRLKIEKEKAYAVISSLLSIVTLKDNLAYDYYAVFEFLLKSTMDNIFE